MGAALSFLGQKLFASSTLINARCENIFCCTSVAAVHPPAVRRTGGFLRKRMTTIYVDSVAGSATSRSTWESPCTASSHHVHVLGPQSSMSGARYVRRRRQLPRGVGCRACQMDSISNSAAEALQSRTRSIFLCKCCHASGVILCARLPEDAAQAK